MVYTKKITAGFALLALFFYSAAACKKGELIEEIGSYKVTTAEYEDYYTTYVDKASIIARSEKSTLYKLMCNPDQIPPHPVLHELFKQLDPKENYKDYREMKIIEQVAKAEGFTDDPVVKKIIEQTVLETVVKLYFQKKLDQRIKISMDDKTARCDELRRTYPQKMAPLPLETCLYFAEGFLKEEIIEREGPRLRDEIKEGVAIVKNKEFDRDDYLENKMPVFNTIKKEGGCMVDGAEASETEKKEN
ncbi:MAG: hypothetical protein OEZ34_11300 [Spirochaetia bacterium]|nr:hypothetical protein [Spirochaetia bacterium]